MDRTKARTHALAKDDKMVHSPEPPHSDAPHEVARRIIEMVQQWALSNGFMLMEPGKVPDGHLQLRIGRDTRSISLVRLVEVYVRDGEDELRSFLGVLAVNLRAADLIGAEGFDDFRDRIMAKVDSRLGKAHGETLKRPLAGDLSECLTVDREQGMRFVRRDEAEAWPLSLDELWALGRENVARLIPADTFQPVAPDEPAAHILETTTNTCYESSVLLDLRRYIDPWPACGVFVLPAGRDLVLVLPMRTKTDLEALALLANLTQSSPVCEQHYPVSRVPYWHDGAEWEKLKPVSLEGIVPVAAYHAEGRLDEVPDGEIVGLLNVGPRALACLQALGLPTDPAGDLRMALPIWAQKPAV